MNSPEPQSVGRKWPEAISRNPLYHLFILHLLLVPALAVGGWVYMNYPFNRGWAAVAFVGWMYGFLVIQCVHPPKSSWMTLLFILDTPLIVMAVGLVSGMPVAQSLILAAFLELFGMPLAMAWSWALVLFKRRSIPNTSVAADSLIGGIILMLLLDAGVMGAFWPPLADTFRGGLLPAASCLVGLFFSMRCYGQIALSGDFGRFPVTGLLLGLLYLGAAFVGVFVAGGIGSALRNATLR